MSASATASRLQAGLGSLESQLDWEPGNPGTLGPGHSELAMNLRSLLHGRMPGSQASFGLGWGCKLTAIEMEAKIKLKPELPRLPCSWLQEDPNTPPSPWPQHCLCRGLFWSCGLLDRNLTAMPLQPTRTRREHLKFDRFVEKKSNFFFFF